MRGFPRRIMIRLAKPNMFGLAQRVRIGGACGPPPPFAAPLRCALSSGATPREGPSAAQYVCHGSGF